MGFAAYSRVTSEGLNQREADFFDAFRRAIDVAIREKVDAILHSGDVFDSVRPTNRAIHHVMSELTRAHAAGIPVVVISGNHEAPRLRETGAVLRLLDFVPGTRSVYKGRTEVVRVGELAVHAVPHAADNDALLEQLRAIRPDPDARYNVAMLHAGVMGVADFRTGEFHEQVVPQNELPAGMDYVALGHYHRATEVAPGVWYAGSTERCTFRELGETKSVNLVDLAAGTVTPIPLATRPMVELPALALEGVPEIEMAPSLYRALKHTPFEAAIARLRVTGMPAHVHATLDFPRVREMIATALHFELQIDVVREDAPGASEGHIGQLTEEFDAFLAKKALGAGEDRDALLAAARELLLSAQTDEGASAAAIEEAEAA